jgi:hypothetical protein
MPYGEGRAPGQLKQGCKLTHRNQSCTSITVLAIKPSSTRQPKASHQNAVCQYRLGKGKWDAGTMTISLGFHVVD